ncbi:MAG: hypothetical protein ABIH82_04830 [Candidatus Woesearchaeota archaeon]
MNSLWLKNFDLVINSNHFYGFREGVLSQDFLFNLLSSSEVRNVFEEWT